MYHTSSFSEICEHRPHVGNTRDEFIMRVLGCDTPWHSAFSGENNSSLGKTIEKTVCWFSNAASKDLVMLRTRNACLSRSTVFIRNLAQGLVPEFPFFWTSNGQTVVLKVS